MKTIIKIFVLLLFSNFGYSQIYYSNYLDQTSEWREIEHHGEAAYHDLTFRTLFFEGFENINGYTYYKMYQTYYKIGYDVGYTTLVDPQSANTTQFIGYFREDPNGKFYLYINGGDTVYFDNQIVLNSQIGDLYFNNFNTSLCQVDALGIMNINATNYKLILSSLGGKSLEGVGKILDSCSSPQSLDSALAPFIRIHCYTKQGLTYSFYDNYYLPFAPINCNTFPNANRQGLSTVTNENSSFKVFPNPANNLVTIESDKESINELELYDLQGRMLKNIKINSLSYKLDISGYQQGTYLLRIVTSSGDKTIKMVKE